MWLDDRRGHLVDWATQRWVRSTGRRVSLTDAQWLDGPAGKPTGIGTSFFDTYAGERGLRLLRGQPRYQSWDDERSRSCRGCFYEQALVYGLGPTTRSNRQRDLRRCLFRLHSTR